MTKKAKIITIIFIGVFMSANKIHAIEPVTYTCCKNYTFSEGIQVSNFENESKWNGNSQEVDYVNYKEGQKGLKLKVINGTMAYSDFNLNQNLSDINNFSFWVYLDNAENEGFIRLSLTSTISGSWNKRLENGQYRLKTGWNRVVLNKNNFKSVNGENWENIMRRARISAGTPYSNSIGNYLPLSFDATFDDLRYNLTGQKAKLIITFDDGLKSVYTKAYPILSANNQRAVSYVVTSRPESASSALSYMNLSDLKELQSAGWDISSHTVSHANLKNLDNSSLSYELNNSYDWLVKNKFQKSAGFLAYPYGSLNDNVIDYAMQKYILARSTEQQGAQQHYIEEDISVQYIQKVIEVYNYTTTQSVKDKIDDVINSKLLGILLFHGIVDSNPGQYEVSTANFKEISDYIKSRSADIDVITNSDYVIPNIRAFTPVVSKKTRIYSDGNSIMIEDNKYDEYMPDMEIKPSSGFIDVDITSYYENGSVIKFNENASEDNIQVSYRIGERVPNTTYNIKIYQTNNSLYKNLYVISDSAGYIEYNSESSKSTKNHEISYSLLCPEAYWNFDESSTENAYDSSGNGNIATLENGLTRINGKSGNALIFDGINDYAKVKNSSSLNITGNQITIEAWVNPSQLKEEYIISKFNGDNVISGYNFLITSNRAYFRLGDGINRYQLAVSHKMSTDTWYHLVAVYNGLSMTIYKNGIALPGSTYFSGNIGGNSNDVNIGQRIGNSYRWNGLIDELKIYNRALSPQEIIENYNKLK